MTLIEKALDRIESALQGSHAHPAHTVVLLPFAQLLPLFTHAWASRHPDGFAPRFATTQSWARERGAPAPTGHDYRFDAGLDALTARQWLDKSGLSFAETLSANLVEACGQLAGVAAAVEPAQRADWAVRLAPVLSIGMEGATLAAEHAVLQLALAWAASSRYPTDVLWTQDAGDTALLLAVAGLNPDPLTDSLVQAWGSKAQKIDALLTATDPRARGHVDGILLYRCANLEDEASTAAACVMQRLAASDVAGGGNLQVALVATDRVLTRRARALLDGKGVAVRDETGWKLSTTRAAATVVASLQACAWNASADDVLDWLKNCPAVDAGELRALEGSLRQTRSRRWASRRLEESALQTWAQQLLEPMQGGRALPAWSEALAAHLQACGLWDPMVADEAGSRVLAALHLTAQARALLADWPPASKRMSLTDYTSWCRNALEGASFVPEAAQDAQVVILPLSQLLARPFAAVVVPGCDEQRLNASPDLPGLWLPAHRTALGLPTRDAQEATMREAWAQVLRAPALDILWRHQGQEGEPLQPSPLVQQWLLSVGQDAMELAGAEPRMKRALVAAPVAPPLPKGSSLPITRLSASAYADLRQCPYKFFALRQLRLNDPPELDVDTEKRDFGEWLHDVLKRFHEGHQRDGWPEPQWPGELDRCAAECTAERKLGPAEFLPFTAAWPQVRDGYLRWWSAHQTKEQMHFASAETEHQMGLGAISLYGRIDRIDRHAGATQDAGSSTGPMVLDYKTESLARSKERVKSPLEDTQIAFYAALLPDDTLRAGYVNISEAQGTELVEQRDVVEARDALLQGIQDDMQAIRDGAVLAAMGEGDACEYCAARGLCRKDFWEASV